MLKITRVPCKKVDKPINVIKIEADKRKRNENQLEKADDDNNKSQDINTSTSHRDIINQIRYNSSKYTVKSGNKWKRKPVRDEVPK